MSAFSREEIRRRSKQAQRGLTFTLYTGVGLAILWFLAGVACMRTVQEHKPSLTAALVGVTMWWLLLPVFFDLPWRLRQRRVKRVAVCCLSCGEPLLDSRAEMLLVTGRCSCCGVKVEVEEGVETITPTEIAAESKLIPRSQLAGRSISRAAQKIGLASLSIGILPFALLLLGVIKDGWWIVAGLVAMFTGISVSLVIVHAHEKKEGGAPPQCPGCGMQLRPFPSNYALLTGHCSKCGQIVTVLPTEQPAKVNAPFTRKQLAAAHKRLLRVTGRLFVLGFALCWVGLVGALWVRVFLGREVEEALKVTLPGCFFVIFLTLLWLLEFRLPKTSPFTCPVCRGQLLGKGTFIPVTTGHCCHCAAKIFGDEE